MRPSRRRIGQAAVTYYAKERNIERDAVVDERAVLRDALKAVDGRGAGPAIKAEFERRIPPPASSSRSNSSQGRPHARSPRRK